MLLHVFVRPARVWGLLLAAACSVPALAAPPEVAPRTSAAYLKPFRGAVAAVGKATVAVRCGGKDVALGAVVGADGWVLTKASELRGAPACIFADGKERPARVVGVHEAFDLALLKVDGRDLPTVEWLDSKEVRPGDFLVTPGPGAEPVAAGVVSVATRRPTPRESARGAYLGVVCEETRDGLRVEGVVRGGPAARAGLKPDDYLLALDGKPVEDLDTLHALLRKVKPGDAVRLKVRRDDEDMELKATLAARPKGRYEELSSLGSKLSERRTGFPVVLQHDTVLRPADCGGPVVNLDGKTVGINIARGGRVESYAIPSEAITAILEDLKSGKLAPRPEPDPRPAR
jgi:S1-C subfamily serine protease